ncbi:23816_t:CDS:1, partial [Dentiscutata erythropus]
HKNDTYQITPPSKHLSTITVYPFLQIQLRINDQLIPYVLLDD